VKTGNGAATVLASTLHEANSEFLRNDKSPSRKTGELDSRGSHYYLALYWAKALSSQSEDIALQARFRPIAKQLADNESKIVAELNAAQGKPLDLWGYYHPDRTRVRNAMRPSSTLNGIISAIA
ncbi:MAG: NADP-dependent isocitrate dehydrogenase, partial [Halioglobus sp.]|nr:NADP-dependent isocitrate dehydrogenase [Halioglobus sp.]